MNYIIPCFILLTQVSIFNSKGDQKVMVNANKIIKYEKGIIYFNNIAELQVKESAAEIKAAIKTGCDK